MRLLALALLVLMLCLFLIGRVLERQDPGFAFLRAFAEAATVGALADWFAVTALFRRPLGLPIPHTAIIPRSKDRIGEGMGRFLERNFLDPAVIERQLGAIDLSGEGARWLLQGPRRAIMARSLAESAPRLLEIVNDPEVERAISRFLLERVRRLDSAGLMADLLSGLTAEGRHLPLVARAVALADRLLQENEAEIRRRVRDETGWVWQLFSVDRKASDALITAVQGAIRDMAEDPESAWRVKLDEAIAQLVERLRSDPETRSEVESGKQALLAQPEVAAYFASIWTQFKQDMRAGAGLDLRELSLRIEAGLGAAARAVLEDPALREALNARLRAWLSAAATARREDVARFVAETIKGWDARTVIDRIEAGVGPDLQYIRISGTLIGGLVGVALHTLTLLFPV